MEHDGRYLKIFFLVLTLWAGLFVIVPTLDYEPILTQGDHGRDLYCFKKTFEGATPYRDYWWQYGPLMPYYYSVFFKIFGVSIQSVLIGRAVLVFLSGMGIYALTALWMTPAMAFITAFFFWVNRPDFFYTFNHIGGVPVIIFIVGCLCYYHVRGRKIYYYLGFLGVIVLSLIRLNLGIAGLTAFILCLGLRDYLNKDPLAKKNILAYAGGGFLTLVIIAGIYGVFVHGLSLSHLKQSLPYLSEYRYDNAAPSKALSALGRIVFVNFTATWPRRLLGGTLLAAMIRILVVFYQGKLSPQDKKNARFFLLSMAIFLILTAHESFVSDSIYRLLWAFPAIVLLMFAVIEFGFRSLSRGIYAGVIVVLLLFVLRTAVTNDTIARYYKQPMNLFEYGTTRVFIANSQWGEHKGDPTADHAAAPEWINAVRGAADYLNNHLKEGELFLALPYDALYYFLTGRDSPVYHLAFFAFIHISPEEEKEMIRELERKEVNYILLSNRAYSLEPHLGIIGRNYCPVLAQYIGEHFEVVATLGDWERPPEFTRHHGVKIWKRKL